MTEQIEIKKIKHVENSRMKAVDDVADLMSDIKQHGLIQPVVVRRRDNALICGNRRLRACSNLGNKTINCVYVEDCSDEDLMIMNLSENIQRKNISSVEIGRICKKLMDAKMTTAEIGQKLSVKKGRVQACVSSFTVTVGTPFADLIVFGKTRNAPGISENMIWKIQQMLGRAIGKKISKQDWAILLRACEKGELTTHNISALRAIMMVNRNMALVKAIEILDRTKIIYAYFNVNKKVLYEEMAKYKFTSDVEFIKFVIRKHNEDLIFT